MLQEGWRQRFIELLLVNDLIKSKKSTNTQNIDHNIEFVEKKGKTWVKSPKSHAQ